MLQTLINFFEANTLLFSLIAAICGYVILRISVKWYDDNLLFVSIMFLSVSLGLLSVGLYY